MSRVDALSREPLQAVCPMCGANITRESIHLGEGMALLGDEHAEAMIHAGDPCEAFRDFVDKQQREPSLDVPRGLRLIREPEDRAREFEEHAGDLLGFVSSCRITQLRGWANRQIRMAEVLKATLDVAEHERYSSDRATFYHRTAEGMYRQMWAGEPPAAPARFRPTEDGSR